MDCHNVSTTTVKVARGAEVFADLPKTGVLRFERQSDAMTGGAEIIREAGEMALHFADGASVYLKDI